VKKRLRRKGNFSFEETQVFFAVVGLHTQAVPATEKERLRERKGRCCDS
jgi:hypothetical protein